MELKDIKPGMKLYIPSRDLSGEAYFCERGQKWYVIHNDKYSSGNVPLDWDFIQESKGFKYSWQISCDDNKILIYDVRLDNQKGDVIKYKMSLSFLKHHLNLVELLETVDNTMVKKSTGFAYKSPENGAWYFLSAESIFTGGSYPPEWEQLKTAYALKGCWQISEELSNSFYYGSTYTMNVLDGKMTEVNLSQVLSRQSHLRYATLNHDTKGVIYYCSEDDRFYFLSNDARYSISGPVGWGHIKNSCDYKFSWPLTDFGSNKIYGGNTITLHPGTYELVVAAKKCIPAHTHTEEMKVGDRVQCLSREEFLAKFGKEKFKSGGEFNKYVGTTGVLQRISSDSVTIRWDLDGEQYVMDKSELKTITKKPVFLDTSGSTAKIYLKGLEPPTSTDAFRFKDESELDKIPSGELDTYKPKKVASDSDVKGTTVPRNKDMENLILLGL